eukprot:8765986-Pyramimonas_sp.AAC.1
MRIVVYRQEGGAQSCASDGLTMGCLARRDVASECDGTARRQANRSGIAYQCLSRSSQQVEIGF